MILATTNVGLFQQWQAASTQKPLAKYSVASSSSSDSGSSGILKKKTQKPIVKSVSFANMAKVKYTLSLEEYSDLEKQDTWYSASELKMVRDAARKTVTAIQCATILAVDTSSSSSNDSSSSSRFDENIHCARGLENRSPRLWAKKKQERAAARNVVLDEQDYQRLHGVSDVLHLSQVYQERTYQSRLSAIRMGTSDYEQIADELQQYHYEQYQILNQQQQQPKPKLQQQQKQTVQQRHHHQPTTSTATTTTSQLSSRSRCNSFGTLYGPSLCRAL